jgi:TusA-related sulfurtransferase
MVDQEGIAVETVEGSDEVVVDDIADNDNEVVDENETSEDSSENIDEIVFEDDKQREYVESLKKERETFKQQLEEKQKFIDRQGTEIGNLRKSETRLREIENKIKEAESTRDNLAEDFFDNRDEYDKSTKELSRLEHERKIVEKELSIVNISRAIPDYDDLKKTEIIEVLKEDGALDYEIPAFLEQLDSNPVLAIQIAKRAGLLRQIKAYNSKLDSKSKDSDNLGKKIDNVNASRTIPSSKTNGSSSGYNKLPHSMSDAELEKAYEDSLKRIRR